MPAASRTFWYGHPGALEGGVIWQGRYERYVRRLVTLLNLVLPVGASGLSLPFDIPNHTGLCDLSACLQMLQLDAGASKGVSFTPGLKLVFGG